MRVQVETYVDERGAEKLRRIRLDDRVVEVADNIDQWHGPGYRYVKVKAATAIYTFCAMTKRQRTGS